MDKDAHALIKQSTITWFDGQRKKNIQIKEDWEDFDNIRLLAIHDISHAPQSVPTIHTIAIQIACIIEIAIQNVIKHKYLLSQDDDQPNTTSNTTQFTDADKTSPEIVQEIKAYSDLHRPWMILSATLLYIKKQIFQETLDKHV